MKKKIDRFLIFMPAGFCFMLLSNFIEYKRKGSKYTKHYVQMFLMVALFSLIVVLMNAFLGPDDMILTEYFDEQGWPWLWIVFYAVASMPFSYILYRFHNKFMERNSF